MSFERYTEHIEVKENGTIHFHRWGNSIHIWMNLVPTKSGAKVLRVNVQKYIKGKNSYNLLATYWLDKSLVAMFLKALYAVHENWDSAKTKKKA